jgi:hypothetical protein
MNEQPSASEDEARRKVYHRTVLVALWAEVPPQRTPKPHPNMQAEKPPKLTVAEVVELVERHYGERVDSVKELNSYDDRNFYCVREEGAAAAGRAADAVAGVSALAPARELVLKVSVPTRVAKGDFQLSKARACEVVCRWYIHQNSYSMRHNSRLRCTTGWTRTIRGCWTP